MTAVYCCSECGREYPLTPDRMTCDDCAALQRPDEPLRGILEVGFDGEVPADWVAWAATGGKTAAGIPAPDPRNLLPVEGNYFPPVPVGNTPLWAPERLRGELGLPRLFLKDDAANPTGSLKDRASYLVAAFAAKHGLPKIVLASTGNAGSSMAGIGAAAGIAVKLYLPATAPPAKLVQARQYGAEIVRVEGTYDDAYDLSLADVESGGGLSRNTAHNPLTIEGKKTAALEIVLDLGGLPDRVYVSAGDGVILSGLYKGFEDLKNLGITDAVPPIVACQADGSSAIARALNTDGSRPFGEPVPSRTLADSISVDVPRGGYYARTKLRKHRGRAVTVSDQAILAAQRKLSASTGLFAEPAASAAFAGLLTDLDGADAPGSNERVVILITGNGLKDIDAAARALEAGGGKTEVPR